MRFILLLIISFFLIFPSYAYDEKIKLNRTYIETDSKKEAIKINLNEMLNFREIKKANKKYASIEHYVKEESKKLLSASSQRINILAISVLENLSTESSEFSIEEITKRYRESINPVKALYYDLQEIMFLYDGKPKNKHHQFLINKFNKIET